jgi:hypothetical protein
MRRRILPLKAWLCGMQDWMQSSSNLRSLRLGWVGECGHEVGLVMKMKMKLSVERVYKAMRRPRERSLEGTSITRSDLKHHLTRFLLLNTSSTSPILQNEVPYYARYGACLHCRCL